MSTASEYVTAEAIQKARKDTEMHPSGWFDGLEVRYAKGRWVLTIDPERSKLKAQTEGVRSWSAKGTKAT